MSKLSKTLFDVYWWVRVFGPSGLVYRLSNLLYVRTIPLSGCMDIRSRYRGVSVHYTLHMNYLSFILPYLYSSILYMNILQWCNFLRDLSLLCIPYGFFLLKISDPNISRGSLVVWSHSILIFPRPLVGCGVITHRIYLVVRFNSVPYSRNSNLWCALPSVFSSVNLSWSPWEIFSSQLT